MSNAMSTRKQDTAGRHGAQLTWAAKANGELAHVSEVNNGLQCGCSCPACGTALIARQGKVREHHFAHASGGECAEAVETALHLAAKEMIAEHRQIVLPAVEIEFPNSTWRRGIAQERRYEIESVEVERKLGTIIPDVVVRVGGRTLLVEVKVTHGVDDEKLKKIRELGLSCVEIDLSDVERDLSRESLKKVIIDDTARKRWVHNVRAHEERKKVLSEATLLEAAERGLTVQADGCPIPARVWNGYPYANMMDDCTGCEHRVVLSPDVGVICDGFRARGIPPPPATKMPRPPPETFDDPEEDPVRAATRWADEKRRRDAEAFARERLEARRAAERAEARVATGNDRDERTADRTTPTAAIRTRAPHKDGQGFRPRLKPQRARVGPMSGRLLYSEVLKKWTEPIPAPPRQRRKKGGRTRRAVRRRGPL